MPSLLTRFGKFMQTSPIPPLLGTPDALRSAFEQLKSLAPYTEPVGLLIHDESIQGYDGATGKVRIYTPEKKSLKCFTII